MFLLFFDRHQELIPGVCIRIIPSCFVDTILLQLQLFPHHWQQHAGIFPFRKLSLAHTTWSTKRLPTPSSCSSTEYFHFFSSPYFHFSYKESQPGSVHAFFSYKNKVSPAERKVKWLMGMSFLLSVFLLHFFCFLFFCNLVFLPRFSSPHTLPHTFESTDARHQTPPAYCIS